MPLAKHCTTVSCASAFATLLSNARVLFHSGWRRAGSGVRPIPRRATTGFGRRDPLPHPLGPETHLLQREEQAAQSSRRYWQQRSLDCVNQHRSGAHVSNRNVRDADLQNVDITLRILFRPVESKLPFIFSNVGVDYDERVLPSITTEVLKAVVVRETSRLSMPSKSWLRYLVRRLSSTPVNS